MQILIWIISGVVAGWLTGLIVAGRGFGLLGDSGSFSKNPLFNEGNIAAVWTHFCSASDWSRKERWSRSG